MSKAEEAFSRAAQCADQAQAARDEETRTFFNRLRDSWLRVANNYQIAESLAADAAPPHPCRDSEDRRAGRGATRAINSSQTSRRSPIQLRATVRYRHGEVSLENKQTEVPNTCLRHTRPACMPPAASPTAAVGR
jgi:hypothetical protein